MAGRTDQLKARYKFYMDRVQQDPIAGGQLFLRDLQSASPKSESQQIELNGTIRQLERILGGDESAWHASSYDIKDAVTFLVNNAIMRQGGLGVLRLRREGIARGVASMITEDVNFTPFTPVQLELKVLVESYGYEVYLLEDTCPTCQRDGYTPNDLVFDQEMIVSIADPAAFGELVGKIGSDWFAHATENDREVLQQVTQDEFVQHITNNTDLLLDGPIPRSGSRRIN